MQDSDHPLLREHERPKLLVAIPMHGYVEGVRRIVQWLHSSPTLAAERWTALIFDDRSSHLDRAAAQALEDEDVVVMNVPFDEGGGPRFALRRAGEIARGADYEAVLTCETDAVPNEETFERMLAFYRVPTIPNLDPDDLVSVSPVYRHDFTTTLCYPSNANWFRTGHGNCYTRHALPSYGDVALADAVPFLFALWRPWALAEITNKMPVLMRLDTRLGNYLTANGYVHARLLDYAVGHADGGAKSRGGLRRTPSMIKEL
jgi:hypothetical protein